MGNIRTTLRENTAGLGVTATKWTFVPQNKLQPRHTQTNGVTELHSVGQVRRMIIPHLSSSGFPKTFNITVWYKTFNRTYCWNVPPSHVHYTKSSIILCKETAETRLFYTLHLTQHSRAITADNHHILFPFRN